MKKIYRGIVEGNVIRLDEKIGLPVGTHALVTLKTIKKEEQKEIINRQLKYLDKGFQLGKKSYSRREELYDR
ncbi:MAG: hypothetical protein V1872_14020 [bacterium]